MLLRVFVYPARSFLLRLINASLTPGVLSLFMRLQRDFHLFKASTVTAELNRAREIYSNIDNKPGDADPRPDWVSLSSNGKTTNVKLEPNGFSERLSSEDGQVVSVGQYFTPPWYNIFGKSHGLEVRSQHGQIEGRTLEYGAGWKNDSHYHPEMPEANAHAIFTHLNSALSPQAE